MKLPEAKRGFVLLPRRWVVERSFAWATRFRRPTEYYEGYASTLADLHLIAFACLMLKQAAVLAAGSEQPLHSMPFPTLPGYGGTPWFLPFVGGW